MKYICGAIFLMSSINLSAQNETRAGGLVLLPPEIEEKMHRELGVETIKGVKANKFGSTRINEYRKKKGKEQLFGSSIPNAPIGEETVTSSPTSTDQLLMAAMDSSLPSAVDNSGLPAFPPIGNQGSVGSCVGWSTAYSLSHNNGMALGWDNKSSSKHRCSASYIYDMVKFSSDCNSGTAFMTAYGPTLATGCLSVDYYPNSLTSCNGFSVNPQAYREALENKQAGYQKINVSQGIDLLTTEEEKLAKFISNIAPVKSLLVNGYVVQFNLIVKNSFVNLSPSTVLTGKGTAPLKSDNSGEISPFVGQTGIDFAVDTGSLPHAMTIVGYDDHAWVDGNRNGIIDLGEVGVFKLANSWGTSWGTNGFAYVTYNLVYKTTGTYFYYVSPRTQAYQPKLLAQIDLDTVAGQTQNFNIGYSSADSSVAQSWMNTTATYPSGSTYPSIPHAYSAKNLTTQNGGVIIDLSDLVAVDGSFPDNFYASITDSLMDANTSRIRNFTLIDPVKNLVRKTVATFPILANGDTQIVANESDSEWTSPTAEPVANQAPIVNAGADQSIAYTSFVANLVGLASDADGSIASVTWAQVSGPSAAAFSSTTNLSSTVSALVSGSYIFRLTAVDNLGSSKSDDIIIVKAQAPANQAPVVNAGIDQTITLPINAVTLNGSVSDSDGRIASMLWTQVSGPNLATLAGQNSLSLSASNLMAGTYLFRLTATDDKGLAKSDDVQVFVKIRKARK